MGLPPLAAAVNETVNELLLDAIEVIVGADGALVVKPEVMTRLPVPVTATATNFSCPAGPPHTTENHWLRLVDEEVRAVHVMPSRTGEGGVTERLRPDVITPDVTVLSGDGTVP
jgi:hypothetical protein